uniref:TNF receptor-associated factor 3-like isoform X2 n=1 Tax=Ciona intestinalis TaxID=7719 RepID=UPI000EF53075|nr:TNF receptor-associated factor 3-like isoform X2 [Ciona intestinalis]|eukprot:XP_026693565.1 TNF receptor-associated factor 3-like isoform X2 [Ciona intestinalis]
MLSTDGNMSPQLQQHSNEFSSWPASSLSETFSTMGAFSCIPSPQNQDVGISDYCKSEHDALRSHLAEISRTLNNLKSSNDVSPDIRKLEVRLKAIQRMTAQQTDRSLALKKEVGDNDAANKRANTDLTQKVEEIAREIAQIKEKQNELERQIESTSSSREQMAPENLSQMVDAFERQLGMYYVRIADMDQRFQVIETTSYSGVVIWKIRDFSRRKREAVSGRTLSLYSQPFYTSRYGYKMCARVYLNGDGMGNTDATGPRNGPTSFVRHIQTGSYVIIVQETNFRHEHRFWMSIVRSTQRHRRQFLRQRRHNFLTYSRGYVGPRKFLTDFRI